MAMTTRPQRTASRKSALTGGFDSLTLDPSVRLRRTRQKMAGESQDTIGNAWKLTGQALVAAMISIGRTFSEQSQTDRLRSSKRSKSS
jgi:hypothetical protein